MTQRDGISILDLPTELRDNIYNELFRLTTIRVHGNCGDACRTAKKSVGWRTAILLCNKTIKAEAERFFLRSLRLRPANCLPKFIKEVTILHRPQCVRDVVVEWVSNTCDHNALECQKHGQHMHDILTRLKLKAEINMVDSGKRKPYSGTARPSAFINGLRQRVKGAGSPILIPVTQCIFDFRTDHMVKFSRVSRIVSDKPTDRYIYRRS